MKDFEHKGGRDGSGPPIRAALVASRYHEEITKNLVDAALRALARNSPKNAPEVFWVPGAYELPQAAHLLAKTGKYDAVVPLGCLIRGETAHFDALSRAVSVGLDAVGRQTGVAVSFGVLTVDTPEQARERAGGKWGNKGEEAALAAVELVKLKRRIARGKPKKGA